MDTTDALAGGVRTPRALFDALGRDGEALARQAFADIAGDILARSPGLRGVAIADGASPPFVCGLVADPAPGRAAREMLPDEVSDGERAALVALFPFLPLRQRADGKPVLGFLCFERGGEARYDPDDLAAR